MTSRRLQMCVSIYRACSCCVHFNTCLFLLSLSTGGEEQEKSEKYLSFATSIVNSLRPDEVPEVIGKCGGGWEVDYRSQP